MLLRSHYGRGARGEKGCLLRGIPEGKITGKAVALACDIGDFVG